MADATPLKTPLFDWHQAHGGRMVDFAGWSMPVQYTSIVEEHQAVRRGVGLFDISHMGRLAFEGAGALGWIDRVTTNDASKLQPNQIQYSLMANDLGGLIDDILVYRLDKGYYVVCNASNRAAVVEQFQEHLEGAKAKLTDRTLETAMIAVQGPSALATLQPLYDLPLDTLKYYHVAMGKVLGSVQAMVSRTGYTGEVGFELIVAAAEAEKVWEALLASGASFGILPCGLGARDTLRFEAGMPLYGHELSATVNPFAAGVGWAVKLDKGDFVGSEALKQHQASPGAARIGLRLGGKRIARQGCTVSFQDRMVGAVTSGTFSPTLDASLAMALVDPEASVLGTSVVVDVRGKPEAATVVALPFYKRPKAEPTADAVSS
ncbi:MAG: glycine cleavage system aminomethyltransferase GcvT [Paludisphaera borealis]|uniref:glycine cleavage system aminomethyltransferase GcvT n=1 Tax=Paludisphaera borealis TaxID=1387353 RepID=UPI0028462593|nr:glycine cleavage system aminomethyltransferase GcvT [Paludisphaera borealis]MDR3617789.1 glycine cleavage system aminomethyltransferase GcvT [Paludisphaera borealis]